MPIQNPFQIVLPASLKGDGLVLPFRGKPPQFGEEVFLAHHSAVIGEAFLGDHVSLWYGAVARADIAPISIGAGSNIQDNSVLHVGDDHPCIVGAHVVVGHAVVLHGCTVGDGATIGMGTIVLNGAVVGQGSVVGAGSLVPPGMKIPENVLALGHPAKVIRALTEEERQTYSIYAPKYVGIARECREMLCPE